MADKALIISAEGIGAMLENELKRENITKTRAEVRAIGEGIAQKWIELSQKGEEINIKEFEAEIRAEFPSISTAAGKAMNEIYDLMGSMPSIDWNNWKLKNRDVNERARKVKN